MSAPARTLSLVIPVYFNEASIPELFAGLQDLEADLAGRGVGLELVFVDDGSGDRSLERLLDVKRARPATKVVALARNFGAVAASKAGFGFVTGDAFMILAADLQDPLEAVVAMVERWLAGARFVVSARRTRADPLATRVAAALYYRVVSWLVVPDYPAAGFDLMLMDKVMLPYMAGSGGRTNPNMYAYWLGFKPEVLWCERRERKHGRSMWTFRKKLAFFLDTLCGFSVAPVRLLSAFGLVVAGLSFLYGANIAIHALRGQVDVRGFATIVTLVSFFSGVILVMLGVLGEYLWRIFDAVQRKPESVIAETFL